MYSCVPLHDVLPDTQEATFTLFFCTFIVITYVILKLFFLILFFFFSLLLATLTFSLSHFCMAHWTAYRLTIHSVFAVCTFFPMDVRFWFYSMVLEDMFIKYNGDDGSVIV